MIEANSGVENRTLRQILPKPSARPVRRKWTPLKDAASIRQTKPIRNPYSGCFVSRCQNRKCSAYLHNHLPWMVDSKALKTVSLLATAQDHLPLDHGLAALPNIPHSIGQDEEFRQLFYQYLSFDMPRIIALMAPPSATQSVDENIRSKTQGVALLGCLAPVYFLLFVSMAHILELARRQQLEPDRVSAKIYGCLTKLVREKLNNYKQAEASNLVLAILALSSFDMSLGNSTAVMNHRNALELLVSHVGLQYLGRSQVYVLTWDRLIAAYTGKPSLYGQMPNRAFLREAKHPKKYGVGFDHFRHVLDLDADVDNLCSDLCRAIEIAEAEQWTFRPERQHSPYVVSDVQYLYFMRDVIQNTCITLQARVLPNSSKSRPVLFAVMILQYIVLGKTELTWYPISSADRLYEVLAEQNLDEEWYGCEDVLYWLMCTMVVVPITWKRRPQALKLFQTWLAATWETVNVNEEELFLNELYNLEDFIWSKSELDDKLAAALKDISLSNPGLRLKLAQAPSSQNTESVMHSSSVQSEGTADSGSW